MSKRLKRPRIEVKDGLILYKARDRQPEVFSYDSELLKILRMNLTESRAYGRLSFQKRKHNIVHTWKIYDVALACYLGAVKAESLIEDMNAFYDTIKLGRAIDHADDNIHNNTKSNLSLMELNLNRTKARVVTRLKRGDYDVTVAVADGGKYRIAFYVKIMSEKANEIIHKFNIPAAAIEGCTACIPFECNGAAEFVECLRMLPFLSLEGIAPLRDSGGRWRKDGEARQEELLKVIKKQQKLAGMDGAALMNPPLRAERQAE